MHDKTTILSLLQVAVPANTLLTVPAEVKILEMLGIVSNPETYSLLLRRTHTIWISAQPEEHMSRVMKQGDFRPMARNREAMADLHAILDARRGDYARAEASLDTSGANVTQSFTKLQKLVAPWIKGKA